MKKIVRVSLVVIARRLAEQPAEIFLLFRKINVEAVIASSHLRVNARVCPSDRVERVQSSGCERPAASRG